MMYVLDTNVLSELRKISLGKADANVAAWAERVDAADLFVSVITVMELELGVLSIESRDPAQGPHCAPGWSSIYYPSSMGEHCLSIPLWRNAALGCTYQISAVNATRSSRRRPWCTVWGWSRATRPISGRQV